MLTPYYQKLKKITDTLIANDIDYTSGYNNRKETIYVANVSKVSQEQALIAMDDMEGVSVKYVTCTPDFCKFRIVA